MTSLRALAPSLSLLALLSACQGLIDAGAAGPGGRGGTVGPDGRPVEVPTQRPETPPGTDPVALAPARLWRLSAEQYEAAFVSAFGKSDVHAADLPRDPVEDGFDNSAGQAFVDTTVGRLYYDNAVAMAARITANLGAEGACLTGANPDDACVTPFLRKYVDRAFRRPATDDELAVFLAVYRAVIAENGAKDAAAAVLEALAQSPNFLYRSELGEAADGDETRLTQYEIASELSFMLTDAPPDAELLAAAAGGELYDRATVREHAVRLLATDAARQKLGRFFGQYLQIRALDDGNVGKDATRFPSDVYDVALQKDMYRETTDFAKYVVFDKGGTLGDLFTSRTSFVTKRLAALYGVEGATSNDTPSMVEMPLGERAGIMTQASVLTVRAKGDESDPLHRGLFIFRDLLCKQTAPPSNIDVTMLADQLKNPDPNSTKREDFEYLQKNSPECAACHGMFVPLGLTLENFDAIGRFRETQFDKMLDTSGVLSAGSSEDGAVEDGPELMARIAESDLGQACFAQRYATYALGRATAVSPRTLLAAEFGQSSAKILDLLLAVTQDDVFYYRTVSEGEVTP